MRLWQVPAEVDTDQLAPGHTMKHGLDVVARHCLEAVRPEFAAQVRPGDVLVAGAGFGIGSSREQAASVLVHLGVAAVVAPSYGGLYFRNAFNVGLLLLTCADAQTLTEADTLTIQPREARIVCGDGRVLTCEPIPNFLLDMVDAGGLLPQLKRRVEARPG
jgi:3-isopropylmalate/(R)-2-methylmalate dehydratase small subunit